MKNKFVIFSLLFIVFIYLLYHEVPGINFLIFGIVTIIAGYFLKKQVNWKRSLIEVLLLISTFSVAYFADEFSVMMSLVLFIVLPVFVFQPKQKLIIAGISAGISFALGFLQIPDLLPKVSSSKKSNLILKLVSFILIPLGVITLFLVLYSQVNLEFQTQFENISFPEIDSSFFLIAFLALIYSLGFVFYKAWIPSKYYEKYTNANLANTEEEESESVQIWSQSGIIVFSILGVLLSVLLFFEFREVAAQNSAQSIGSFSEAVHFSVGAVIGSIVTAILLIMLYFNGKLNFSSSSTSLKTMAVIWLVLNVVLLVTTGLKNQFYIHQLGLTGKRLGVCAFLLLSLTGIVFTIYKILRNKTSFYLIEHMAWVFLVFGAIITPFNWSECITQYNIQQSEANQQKPDIQYLWGLPYNDCSLLELNESHPEWFTEININPKQKAKNHSQMLGGNTSLSYNWYGLKLRALLTSYSE